MARSLFPIGANTMTMKYVMMAAVAASMVACSSGPEDRMEERSDRDNIHETPEMSGDRDQMREPIDEVNPPEDAIPFQHEIRNDSTIAPAGDGNTNIDTKLMDAERPDNNDDRSLSAPTHTGNTTTGTTEQTTTGTSTTTTEGTTTSGNTVTTSDPDQANTPTTEPGSTTTGTPDTMEGIPAEEAVPANPN